MNAYILIIMMVSQQGLITMQEFDSRAACDNAIKEMRFTRKHIKPFHATNFIGICVPKNL